MDCLCILYTRRNGISDTRPTPGRWCDWRQDDHKNKPSSIDSPVGDSPGALTINIDILVAPSKG